MSRPVPSSRALRALRAQLGLEAYTCTSCQHLAAVPASRSRRLLATQARPRQPQHWHQHHVSSPPSWPASSTPRQLRRQSEASCDGLKQQRRNAAHVAPVTSVNAARSVPERNRELHAALSSLESVAAEYVNLSQLALALRGLEARDPVTRVAVIVQSSTSLDDALRLVRLMLVDTNQGNEQSWEAELLQRLGEEKALLIRHGPEFDVDTTNPLVQVVSVPTPTLEKYRLELLLVQKRNGGESAGEEDDSLASSLVLTIETPISATGRYSQVTYPVHKSLFFGKGIGGLLGAQYEEVDPENRWNIARYATIDVGESSPSQPPPTKGLSLISITQAENAIKAMRQEHGGDAVYRKDWPGSHVADASKFILAGVEPTSTLKPLHRAYISHILAAASTQLASEQNAIELSIPSIEEIEASVTPLRAAIKTWAESAHTELRNELANAFAGRSWDKLVWWKLPFRVDDVGMIGTDILGRFYLADAEKGIIWVGGRLEQAGLTNSTESAKEAAIIEKAQAKVDDDSSGNRETPDTYFRASAPWPQQIALSRGLLLSESLPTLQARAQSLLIEALSGTSISAAVGALAYTMVSTTGIYEAGSVFAFGTVITLKRLQRLWDKARDAFVQDVQNEGRSVLEEVERECVDVINQGTKVKEPEGQETRDAAARAIEEAREALDRLK